MCMPWIYLYRRMFLLENNLFYRKNWICEDMEFEPRLLSPTSTIVVAHRPVYHYVRRVGSITRAPANWKKIHDLMGNCLNWINIWKKSDDRKMKKYMISFSFKNYMWNVSNCGLCGWQMLNTNAVYSALPGIQRQAPDHIQGNEVHL